MSFTQNLITYRCSCKFSDFSSLIFLQAIFKDPISVFHKTNVNAPILQRVSQNQCGFARYMRLMPSSGSKKKIKMKLRLSSCERACADIEQMNSDRATRVWTDSIQRVHTSYTGVCAVPWKLRQNNDTLFIAANGRYFEKVTNSLNVDDEDDDSDYSGNEWRVYCIPNVL